jgi:glycosyltransferase involved in cell wall biosynthesis
VTVVIPTRDRWALLAGTLASVLAQRDVAIEVVVVDDGSREARDAAAIAGGDPRVRVLRHATPEGVAAARNAGLAAARARWVAFTDDDDLWAPDKLAAQLEAMARVPGARWSCVGALHVNDDLEIIGCGHPPRSGDVAELVLTKNVVPGGASGVLASTEIVAALGGFDEALANSADYDMWIRLALHAPVATVDRPLVAYRVHAAAMSRRLERFAQEADHLRWKHAAERARRGVTPSGSIHVWIGDRHQRSGRRLQAARSYLAARSALGSARTALRCLEALVWPGAMRLRDRRRGARVPPDWTAAGREWLPRPDDRSTTALVLPAPSAREGRRRMAPGARW